MRARLYIKRGGVKLSVVSTTGREAVVALLGVGDFFGEGCLAGQRLRMRSATSIATSTIVLIGKAAMVELLHNQHAMSDRFISHLLRTTDAVPCEFLAAARLEAHTTDKCRRRRSGPSTRRRSWTRPECLAR
jgi:CRP-like cAMP-binding protein